MNLSEKRRAELFVREYSTKKASKVRHEKTEPDEPDEKALKLRDEVVELVKKLKTAGYRVHIETHGDRKISITTLSNNRKAKAAQKRRDAAADQVHVEGRLLIERIWTDDITFAAVFSAIEGD